MFHDPSAQPAANVFPNTNVPPPVAVFTHVPGGIDHTPATVVVVVLVVVVPAAWWLCLRLASGAVVSRRSSTVSVDAVAECFGTRC